jgi:hypothetical protein
MRYVESIIRNARTLIISFTRHKCNTHPKYELHMPNLWGLSMGRDRPTTAGVPQCSTIIIIINIIIFVKLAMIVRPESGHEFGFT